MALLKTKGQGSYRVLSSGSTTVDAGKLLGSKQVRDDLVAAERLFKTLTHRSTEEMKPVLVVDQRD